MNGLDSGFSTARVIVSAQTHPDGCFLFSPVRDASGKVIDLRCADVDLAAQALVASLETSSRLRGLGGSGLLDLPSAFTILSVYFIRVKQVQRYALVKQVGHGKLRQSCPESLRQ